MQQNIRLIGNPGHHSIDVCSADGNSSLISNIGYTFSCSCNSLPCRGCVEIGNGAIYVAVWIRYTRQALQQRNYYRHLLFSGICSMHTFGSCVAKHEFYEIHFNASEIFKKKSTATFCGVRIVYTNHVVVCMLSVNFFWVFCSSVACFTLT